MTRKPSNGSTIEPKLPGPLEGIRVLSLGGVWAGRVASMLLADQRHNRVHVSIPGFAKATGQGVSCRKDDFPWLPPRSILAKRLRKSSLRPLPATMWPMSDGCLIR